ncbi:MAG TPA: helix-hairpin-helix domain-containing protein [Thermoanaerobaculia bacterium]|jgi:competence protein ComEA
MRKSLPIFILALGILSYASLAMADGAAPADSGSKAGVVNINTADAAQLALLPRIGAKGAERIIAYRTQHGPFKKTADLMQVKGVGAKTFELLTPYIALEGKTTLTTNISSPRKPRAKKPTTTTASN